jgi:hypothetical protein
VLTEPTSDGCSRAREESEAVERAVRAEGAHKEHGEGRTRTGDTPVFSRVLYQLSYLAADATV